MKADMALLPWYVLFISLVVYIMILIGYFLVSDYFFLSISAHGARIAAVNPDVNEVKNSIYDTIRKTLPVEANGITLISPNDITIVQNDGQHVTTTVNYLIALPGTEFFQRFGVSAVDMTVPVEATFSYYRDFEF